MGGMFSLESQLCDLSLLEARGLRGGALSGIRRMVDPAPVEVRPGLWAWYVLGGSGKPVPLDEMKAAVAATAQWSAGRTVLVREPWRSFDVEGKQRVQYRADGEIAERARGGARKVIAPSGSPRPAPDDEWRHAADLPEWAWRMKARILGVQVSTAPVEPVGTIWTIDYEMKVMACRAG